MTNILYKYVKRKIMYNVANSALQVDNINIDLIDHRHWLPILSALVRANCIIGIISSRHVRVPGSFRDLSGLALRFRYLPLLGMIHSVVVVVAAGRRIRRRWRACSITITIRVVTGASTITINRIKVRRGAALPAMFVLEGWPRQVRRMWRSVRFLSGRTTRFNGSWLT